MPGDSVIKELNLRLGPGKVKVAALESSYPATGASSRLSRSGLSAGAEPTSHHSQKRYTEGVKQNPARARRAASKSSAPSPCVGAPRWISERERVERRGGGRWVV